MRAWLSCKAGPTPTGSPASARRHPRTSPATPRSRGIPRLRLPASPHLALPVRSPRRSQAGTGFSWPAAAASIGGPTAALTVCASPTVPKARWEKPPGCSASGKQSRTLPAARCQRVAPRQPRPWQPAGCPCPRRAQPAHNRPPRAGSGPELDAWLVLRPDRVRMHGSAWELCGDRDAGPPASGEHQGNP